VVTFIIVVLAALLAAYAYRSRAELLDEAGWELPRLPGSRRHQRRLAPARSGRSGARITLAFAATQAVEQIVDGMQVTRFTGEVVLRDTVYIVHAHPTDYPVILQNFDSLVRDVDCGTDLLCEERGFPRPQFALERVVSDPGQAPGQVKVLTRAESKGRHAELMQLKERDRRAREQASADVAAGVQRLVLVEGDGPETIELSVGANVIGRHPACGSGQVMVGTVSRRHVELEVMPDGRAFVADSDSRHGTSVDGERIEPGAVAPIGSGALIGFGSKLCYRFEAPAPALNATADEV
jgi:hypothetical protein